MSIQQGERALHVQFLFERVSHFKLLNLSFPVVSYSL